MAPKKDKGKKKIAISQGSTNRGKKGRNSTTQAEDQSPPRTPPTQTADDQSPPSPATPPSPAGSQTEFVRLIRRPRTNSMGRFGEELPRKPTRIDIHGGRIFDDQAKKTLLAILRDLWPVGSYTYTDIIAKKPDWMDDVVNEFKCFYKNLRGQSRTEANWSIREHVKRTCKKMMNEEKRRLVRKMKETGKSAKDLRPGYFQGPFWENLLKYWDSDTHKHRSKVGSQNREKVETLHTAGAKSFEAIEMEMTAEKKGKKPKRLELWERTHTTKASRKEREASKGKKCPPLVYTTPGAMAIASRYSAILENSGVDLTPGSDYSEPIEWWLQATTDGANTPKKNRLIGFPTVPANTLLPNLAHRFRETTRGGASSSSSVSNRSNIPDPLFVQVVRNALTNAQANPTNFQQQLDTAELEGLARNLIEVSDPESRGNFNSIFFREVVNVVTTIMSDICNKYEAGTQAAIAEANKDVTDGESSENDLGEDDGDGAGEDASDDASDGDS